MKGLKQTVWLTGFGILVVAFPMSVPAQTADTKQGAAKAGAPASAAKKKAEPKIEGIVVARPNGTWMGLDARSGVFCLSFYDAKKKPMTVDVVRASARWQSPKFKNPFLDVLNTSSDGKALFGAKAVVPPRNFKVFLTLLSAEGQAVESYVVDYHE